MSKEAKKLNPLTMTDQELIEHCNKQVQALRMALDMIECEKHDRRHVRWAIVDALKEWQPAQQEPVVFYRCNGCGHAYEQVHPTSCDCMEGSSFAKVNYYTSPPAQRTWVGLTNQERESVIDNSLTPACVVLATEAKLKEKNA